MEHRTASRSVGDPLAPAIDAAVGVCLVTVTGLRVVLGGGVDTGGWQIAAIAALVVASLVARGRWPLAALGAAAVAAVLAVPVDLRGSAIDAIVGSVVLAGTAVRLVVAAAAVTPRDALRRRWRVAAVVAVALVAGAVAAPVDLNEAPAVALALAACSVGIVSDRAVTVMSTLATVVAVVAGSTLIAPGSWTGPDTAVPLVAAAVVGAAIGDAVRSRRDLVAAGREDARRVEQVLTGEAQRRLVEQRLSIARDVHDLVAHHIAVVNVQAGVATHLVHDRPDGAAEALAHVRTASRTVLDELATLLAVLRGSGDDAAPVEPLPTLAELERLVGSFAATGLDVDCAVSGARRALPPTVDLAAYRVVQESLTNARRHGDGRAQVRLRYTAGMLHVEVRNGCPTGTSAAAPGGAGHGLAGMRERVATVGGTFDAGPVADGRFLVSASLPAPSVSSVDVAP